MKTSSILGSLVVLLLASLVFSLDVCLNGIELCRSPSTNNHCYNPNTHCCVNGVVYAIGSSQCRNGFNVGETPAIGDDVPAVMEGSACYTWNIFPNLRIFYSSQFYADLISTPVRGQPSQSSHSMHGKGVGFCGVRRMSVAIGSIILGLEQPDENGERGSRMGVHVISEGENCRSVRLECSSFERSVIPSNWTCYSRNDFGVAHGNSTLFRVLNPLSDALCLLFQNGFRNVTAPIMNEKRPCQKKRCWKWKKKSVDMKLEELSKLDLGKQTDTGRVIANNQDSTPGTPQKSVQPMKI